MNSKVIVAAIVGAIVYFLLGWLIFGILMGDSMEAGMSENMKLVYRGMDNYIYWSFALGNLAMAFLLAIILNRFGVRSFGKGFINGLWIGLLIIIGFDFGMYAQFTLFELDMILMDCVIGSIFTGIIGGVIGWMLGMGNKKASTV